MKRLYSPLWPKVSFVCPSLHMCNTFDCTEAKVFWGSSKDESPQQYSVTHWSPMGEKLHPDQPINLWVGSGVDPWVEFDIHTHTYWVGTCGRRCGWLIAIPEFYKTLFRSLPILIFKLNFVNSIVYKDYLCDWLVGRSARRWAPARLFHQGSSQLASLHVQARAGRGVVKCLACVGACRQPIIHVCMVNVRGWPGCGANQSRSIILSSIWGNILENCWRPWVRYDDQLLFQLLMANRVNRPDMGWPGKPD